MHRTYVLLGGYWKYLYRAIEESCLAVAFLLTPRRDVAAAHHCLQGRHMSSARAADWLKVDFKSFVRFDGWPRE